MRSWKIGLAAILVATLLAGPACGNGDGGGTDRGPKTEDGGGY